MSNSSGMSDFARQQAEFQRGILTGDDTVLSEILDSPREKRDTLFGVYLGLLFWVGLWLRDERVRRIMPALS